MEGGSRTGGQVIDVDSTTCQVHGRLKAGAAYGYTKVLGYQPILATRATTGEIIHARSPGTGRDRRGALISITDGHRALTEVGVSLPSLGARSWHAHVIVTPVGPLGTFRRSRRT